MVMEHVMSFQKSLQFCPIIFRLKDLKFNKIRSVVSTFEETMKTFETAENTQLKNGDTEDPEEIKEEVPYTFILSNV
jgi:hypothetical protein